MAILCMRDGWTDRNSPGGPDRFSLLAAIRPALLVLVFVSVSTSPCLAPQPYVPDTYTSAAEKNPPEPGYFARQDNQRRTREAQDRYRLRVPIPDAVAPEDDLDPIPEAGPTLRAPLPPQPSPAGKQPLVATVFVLSGILAVLKLGPRFAKALNTHFNPWELVPCGALDYSASLLAEHEGFASFLTALKSGPTQVRREPAAQAATPASDSAQVQAAAAEGLLKDFLTRAPATLAGFCQLLAEVNRESGDGVRHRLLRRLREGLGEWRDQAGLPQLLPVWQLASAIEGLVKQLTDKLSNVTPSTLRTVANGLDLLKDLCRPGLRPDLMSQPPLRLLAVDDEPISRHAVSSALKRGLGMPDLASDSTSALALANQHSYDVIFLDVQMPGMDGFELCSHIHQTPLNRATPIVFVTSQSDFNARAKSTLSGGHDLIGKPFLAFEITVKALTLVLRARLDAPAPATESAPPPARAAAPAPAPLPEPAATAAPVSRPRRRRQSQRPRRLGRAERRRLARGLTPATPGWFFAHAPSQLRALCGLLQDIAQASEAERQDLLLDVYLRAHALTPLADLPELRPAFQICQSLEGLLKKLLDDPARLTPSTLHTATTALELLKHLCLAAPKVDPASQPPIRILAVDDDPIARRAITGALQVAFEKPESVDGGEAALALAKDKPFDVIFLDVCMPGLDGFAVCAQLRGLPAHRQTPVVFVTALADRATRAKALACGNSDLIAKPFLAIEITLKALTLALRRRLAIDFALLPPPLSEPPAARKEEQRREARTAEQPVV